jgi:hypothetical protein
VFDDIFCGLRMDLYLKIVFVNLNHSCFYNFYISANVYQCCVSNG